MKNILAKLEKDVLLILKDIAVTADQRKITVYVVGGFVRDILLKRKNLDLDVVAEGDALSFAQDLAAQKGASLIMHKQFGTATLILANNIKIDMATARSERYSEPGALPVVEKGNLKDDLFRRDFTINALAVRLNGGHFGELVDEYNGLSDLWKKKIRVLHAKSFIDDPTRILRAVRFEQRFRFHMEKGTLALLKSSLAKQVFDQVKPERYFAEFKKILSEDNPKNCLIRLYQLNGFKFLGKDFHWDESIAKNTEKIGQNLVFWKENFSNKGPIEDWVVYFMVLTLKVPVLKLKDLMARFNLRRIDRERITESHEFQKVIAHLKVRKMPASQVYKLLKPFSYETILFWRALGSEKIVCKRIDEFLSKYDAVTLAVNGDDLKAAGIESGKDLGHLLDQLLSRKIDGVIHTREEELKYARDRAMKK